MAIALVIMAGGWGLLAVFLGSLLVNLAVGTPWPASPAMIALVLVGLTFNPTLLPLGWRWPLRYSVFLPAVWVGLRLGIRGAAAICALLPVAATAFFWISPYGLVSLHEFRALQLILILSAFTAMVVAVTFLRPGPG